MDRVVDYTYRTPHNLELIKKIKEDPSKYTVWVDNDIITVSERLSKEQRAGLSKHQIQLLEEDLNDRATPQDFDVWGEEMIIFLLQYMGIDGQHV